jgi:hypothetical protein
MPTTNTTDTAETTTTPPRSVRVPDELWKAGRWLADVRRETLSDVLNVALAQYVLDGMLDREGELTDIDRQKLHDTISEKEVRRIIRRRTP